MNVAQSYGLHAIRWDGDSETWAVARKERHARILSRLVPSLSPPLHFSVIPANVSRLGYLWRLLISHPRNANTRLDRV